MPRTNRADPVSSLQQDRSKRHPLDSPAGRPSECVTPNCTGAATPDAPVPLCGKHIRETWQYAQGVIEDRLLLAALQVIE